MRLKEFVQQFQWRIRAWESRYQLDLLIASRSAVVSTVGTALTEALRQTLSQDEARYISQIEQRRLSLLQSSDVIDVIDFGAGSGDAVRTKEEAEAGVKIKAEVSQICRASKPELSATLLFKLIRKLKPQSSLELGTCVGISAAYMAAAMTLNNRGTLLTLEGSPEIARLAGDTLRPFTMASVVIGPFHETYQRGLEAAGPLGFLFIDGHHDRDATIEYFSQALPHMADESVVVFDDISWSRGMRQAWNSVSHHERVRLAIDLRTMGIAVLSREPTEQRWVSLPLL